MYYVVPQGQSVDNAIARFENFPTAQDHALDSKRNTGEEYVIVEMRYIWSTQKLSDVVKDKTIKTTLVVDAFVNT
jgi:hypothetical protein